MQRIRIAAVLILALAFATGCQSISNILNNQKPTAHLTNVSLAGVNLTSADLLFDINVENPYDVALPLTNLSYTLASGGKTFLTGDAALTGSIPAKGSKALAVPASLKFAELLAVLPSFKLGSALPYDATLNLSFNAPAVGPLQVPLTKSGALTIPKPF